jgi:two-component system sensor histidine kinase UhpB
VRWQVLATFVLINIVAAAATAAIVIFNAKRATEVEIAASISVAERLVQAKIDELGRTIPGGIMLEDLLVHVGPLRHIRLLITTASGRPVWLARSPSEAIGGADRPAPRWFAAMIEVDDLSREIPVLSFGRHIGTVVVIGDPRDEIAEIWADTANMAAVAVLVDISVILLLYFALGRVLTPLSALSEGLHQLERGRLTHRLAEPKSRELADLARRFNMLAGSLGLAQAENIRLNRRLMTAQEDERRLIAKELHDELGPCLFGLRANMASLDRLAADRSDADAGRMRDRMTMLAEIADRIQAVNRRLLQRLRPIALGDIPLSETLAALVSEFAQHEGAPQLAFHAPGLAQSYGDCIDLTLYRCLQEGLTNAVRHSRARAVEIRIEETAASPCGGGGEDRALRLMLQDNGRGITVGRPFGMGLTGMKERVQALGGAFAISAPPAGGTRLEFAFALEAADGIAAGAVAEQAE